MSFFSLEFRRCLPSGQGFRLLCYILSGEVSWKTVEDRQKWR